MAWLIFPYRFLGCFFLMSSPFICCSSSFSSYSNEQSLALLQFKLALSSKSSADAACYPLYSPNTLDWKVGTDCCSWIGVTCDLKTGNVIELDLSCRQLHGTIHSDSTLFLLNHLQRLNLASNSLNGTILSWLINFPSLLYLDLSYNRFKGQISEFQHRSLQEIHLDSNELDGPIPLSLFLLVNLTDLTLSSNNLSGVLDLTMFSNLQNLGYVDLSFNRHLSFSSKDNVNFTLPNLGAVILSSCNANKFPGFIKALKYVELLDLSDNDIRGQIPEWLGDVGTVSLSYLNLSHNLLTGDLQQVAWNWADLYCLDLHSNLLEGELRIPMLTLNYISLSQNRLSGQIPSLVCNMSSLRFLDLSDNNLTGEIPHCSGNFSKQLQVLNLGRNGLQGSIPQMFENGSMLRTLDVNNNRLDGLIPRSLGNCTNLEVLNLGNNMIEDTFPSWLETLPALKVLVLRSNRFHGPIGQPENTKAFNELNIIDLSFNDFSGNLPSEYFKIWNSMMVIDQNMSQLNYISIYSPDVSYYYYSVTVRSKGLDLELVRILTIFKAVDCSNNKFVGEIPYSIGNLKALRVLNLSGNGLMGHLRSSLGNLRYLESLDLSKNKLSGSIPVELTTLTFLAVFDVSQNNLTGPIPRGSQFDTFSNTSYEGNTGLCGFPLSTICGDVKVGQPSSPPSQQGQNSEVLMDGFTWQSVFIGYGCGTVFGIVVGWCIIQRKEDLFIKIFAVGKHRQRKRLNKVRTAERKEIRFLTN